MQQLSGARQWPRASRTPPTTGTPRFIALKRESAAIRDQFGIPLQDFHALCRRIGLRSAACLHDRIVDPRHQSAARTLRARLTVLSEIPEAWARFAELVLDALTAPSRTVSSATSSRRRSLGTGPDRAQRVCCVRREGDA